MKTIRQQYGYDTIGQGGNLALMIIWDKYYYAMPSVDAANLVGISREQMARLCCDHKLIAKKIHGRYWVALKPAVIASQNEHTQHDKLGKIPIELYS